MTLTVQPHRETLGLKDGRLLIGGEFRESDETWTHHHPATGEEIGSFAVASEKDVDAAVRAARKAFDEGTWPRSKAGERIKVLRKYGDLLREHADELKGLQALDNGVPLTFGQIYATSVGIAADIFDHHAGWIDKVGGQTLPPYQTMSLNGSVIRPSWMISQRSSRPRSTEPPWAPT